MNMQTVHFDLTISTSLVAARRHCSNLRTAACSTITPSTLARAPFIRFVGYRVLVAWYSKARTTTIQDAK